MLNLRAYHDKVGLFVNQLESAVMTQSFALEFKNLAFCYPNSEDELINIENFCLDKGSSVLLYGPSGSGKSTLLNLITGLLAPTAGQVVANKQVLTDMSQAKRDSFRARHMGVITQKLNLLPYLTVLENLKLMLKFAHKPLVMSAVDELLESLNLPTQKHQQVRFLSVGQQQRAAIARALVHEPELIIADEPTSALDDENKARFMNTLLEQTQKQGLSLFMVSHDLSLKPYFEQCLEISHFQQAQQPAQEAST